MRALVRRPSADYLLVRAGAGEPWELPGGVVPDSTDEQEFLRRCCYVQLGLGVGVMIPQELLHLSIGAEPCVCRPYLCPITHDDALPLGVADVCWARPAEIADRCLTPLARVVLDRPGLTVDRLTNR